MTTPNIVRSRRTYVDTGTDVTKFNKGVQILLDRMDSNPEEFRKGSRWQDVIDTVTQRMREMNRLRTLDYPSSCSLTDLEVLALWKKLHFIHAEEFTEDIMRRLLGAADDSSKK